MPALVNAVRNQSVINGAVPVVISSTQTSGAIDISAYEGQIAITQTTGAVAGAGTLTTTLTFSTATGGSYAAITGVAAFTATTGATTVETIFVDTNAVPGFMKILSTLAGTSVAAAYVVTGVKKVQ